MSFKNIFRSFREKYDFIKNKLKKSNIFWKKSCFSNKQCEPILTKYNRKSFEEITNNCTSYHPTIRCGSENEDIYIPSKSLLLLKYQRLVKNIDCIKQFNCDHVNNTFNSYVVCLETSARFKRVLWAKPHQPVGRWTNPLLYLISKKRHNNDISTVKPPKQNVSPSRNNVWKYTPKEDMFTLGNKHPSQFSAEQYLVYLYYKEYDRIHNTAPSSSKQSSKQAKCCYCSWQESFF
ncbi:uncharacterized protein LOC136084269 [Hydra vulgaris]|uniref:Uncharacterized protein LOC136084269 n=1 Tax=Hydra vulgaris TaxID=6087 RepID=A0ABM4CFE1_HYDVU